MTMRRITIRNAEVCDYSRCLSLFTLLLHQHSKVVSGDRSVLLPRSVDSIDRTQGSIPWGIRLLDESEKILLELGSYENVDGVSALSVAFECLIACW